MNIQQRIHEDLKEYYGDIEAKIIEFIQNGASLDELEVEHHPIVWSQTPDGFTVYSKAVIRKKLKANKPPMTFAEMYQKIQNGTISKARPKGFWRYNFVAALGSSDSLTAFHGGMSIDYVPTFSDVEREWEEVE
jgi:hypothetical protein